MNDKMTTAHNDWVEKGIMTAGEYFKSGVYCNVNEYGCAKNPSQVFIACTALVFIYLNDIWYQVLLRILQCEYAETVEK